MREMIMTRDGSAKLPSEAATDEAELRRDLAAAYRLAAHFGKAVPDTVDQHAKFLLHALQLDTALCTRPAAQLSTGQQQRVAIARTLAMSPEAILFDEPTSALDPQMTAEVTAVIADLASSGQTMIVVTHSMGFARTTAHRVHILHSGNIIESGSPQDLFEHPQHAVTRDFLQAVKS